MFLGAQNDHCSRCALVAVSQILVLVDELVSSAASLPGRKMTTAVDGPLSPSQQILLLVDELKKTFASGFVIPTGAST